MRAPFKRQFLNTSVWENLLLYIFRTPFCSFHIENTFHCRFADDLFMRTPFVVDFQNTFLWEHLWMGTPFAVYFLGHLSMRTLFAVDFQDTFSWEHLSQQIFRTPLNENTFHRRFSEHLSMRTYFGLGNTFLWKHL